MNHRPQPLQAPRTRWFWPSRLLLAAVLLVGMPGRAGAVTGLTGDVFKPERWNLLNSNVSTTQPLVWDGAIYNYICGANTETYNVSCINDTPTTTPPQPPQDVSGVLNQMNQGSFYLIGSDWNDYGFIGGSNIFDSPSTSTFYIQNDTTHNFLISFSATFNGYCDGADTDTGPPIDPNACTSPDYEGTSSTSPTFSILKGTSGPLGLGGDLAVVPSYTGSFKALNSVDLKLLSGEYLSFQIYTNNNSLSTTPVLGVNNFNFIQEVPAPIPAFGAATAFAYSRRIRQRIKAHKRYITMPTS